MNAKTTMLALDCHVHLYQFGDLPKLLRAATANSQKNCRHTKNATCNEGEESILPTLILTETNSRDSYGRLSQTAATGKSIDGWRLRSGGDGLSVFAEHGDGAVVLLISGQQVVTAEGLEILAVACRPDIEDGQTLADSLSAIRRQNAFPVLPWGVGKWLGRRGRLLAALIAQAEPGDFALADTISRPVCWPESRFAAASARGLVVLRGTDPLPIPGQVEKVGAFGSLIAIAIAFDCERPAASLLAALANASLNVIPYGQPDPCLSLLRAQLALRVRRGQRRATAG